MPPRRPHRPPSEQARSQLYTQLGALMDAGLPTDRALATLAVDHTEVAPAIKALTQRLQNGQTFAAAAKGARVTDAFDEGLIAAAESAGRLGPALTRLGAWYEGRESRRRKVRSGLIFPALVLTLAAFVQPLPGLIGGSLTLAGYLLAAARVLAVFAVLIGGSFWLFRYIGSRRARKANGLDRLRLSLPLIGPHHQRIQMLNVLNAFEMMYTAGLTPDRAIALAGSVTNNGCIRGSFAPAAAKLAAGQSITSVLSDSPYVSARAHEFLKAGEAAGDLSTSLQRFVAIESDAAADTDKAFADWIPRIVYALVAGWMVSTLI